MFALLAVTLLMQEPRVVPNRIECARCTIQLVPAVTLGGNPDDLIEWPQAVSEDRLGRYYVTQPNKKELPVVFDATGRRMAVLGAAGEGPGEFVRAAIIAVDPRTDTIFVTDWNTSRLSVFSPQLKFVRSFRFPGRARALGVLHDRRLVTMARISDRASIGLPFHIFRQDGQRTRAIGDQRRPYTTEREMFFTHKLTPSRRDGFWAVPLWGEYRIEHWTTSGVRDAYLVRRPAWHFVLESSFGRAANPEEMETPPSSNVGVAETGAGLLWVVTRVADSNRKRAVMDTLRNVDGKYVTARDPDQMWDSVIELIDPMRGVVVAAQRFDELFVMVLPSGKVVSVKETDAGLQVRVFALRLSREQ
jgi:hypothetical protein